MVKSDSTLEHFLGMSYFCFVHCLERGSMHMAQVPDDDDDDDGTFTKVDKYFAEHVGFTWFRAS